MSDAGRLFQSHVRRRHVEQSLAEPLPLKASEREDSPYRIALSELGDGYWRFAEIAHGNPFSFDFRVAPADEALFARKCQFPCGAGFCQLFIRRASTKSC